MSIVVEEEELWSEMSDKQHKGKGYGVIEGEFTQWRREVLDRIEELVSMADTGRGGVQRALKDYSRPTIEGCASSIRRPPIQANTFEIKPEIIQLIQHSGSITTWNELAQAFLTKFFPPVKFAKMRSDITNFFQQDMESLYEVWERYKDLLRSCPHHGLLISSQVQTFYNGLLPNIQVMIDAASGGAPNNKTLEKAYKLIEVMASNNYMRPLERNVPRRVAEVHEVDGYTALATQLSAIQKQLGVALKVNAIKTHSLTCEFCVGNHLSRDCQEGSLFAQPEQVHYVNNFQKGQGNPYLSTYTPAWENHPNCSWSNNNYPKPPPSVQVQEAKSNLEDVLIKFMEESGKRFDKNEAQLQKYEVLLQNQSASIRNLETQMGQIHSILVGRVQGMLSSDIKKNPKEQLNAIMLRSGKELKESRKLRKKLKI
ncbi:uncharacterized protein LOC116144754 [Pistacia vera]|uniref:uncharacterized protein LOC116144754 n=1 Tax=Pistacia vera TaxID=55513 RepID=UPI001262EAB6|nr:uncharacterized protein LOC116144754 [Pistacia vera]